MDETSKKKPSLEEDRQHLEERIKELEKVNSDLQRERDKLKYERDRLQKETEVLKEEIKHLKKPKWAKPNKKSEFKKNRNKIGAKKGHKANPRKPVEQEPDQEIVWVG